MRRRVFLTLLVSALLASCIPPRIPTPPFPDLDGVSPWPARPLVTPDQPGYVGPGDHCPFMWDYCRGQFIYETSLEGSHAPPSSGPHDARGGAPRASAPRT